MFALPRISFNSYDIEKFHPLNLCKFEKIKKNFNAADPVHIYSIAVTLFVNMTDDIKWKILLNTKDYQNDTVSRPKRELEPSKFNQSPKDRSKLIWLSAGISCQSQGLCAIVCEAARLLLILVCYISWSCDALPIFWKRCSKTPPE